MKLSKKLNALLSNQHNLHTLSKIYTIYIYIYIYIHTHKMEYYSAFKEKEILPLVTTQKKLEDTILNEISQTQKDKHCIFYLYAESEIVKLKETADRMLVAKSWSMREKGKS